MIKYVLMFLVFAGVTMGVLYKAGGNISLGDENAPQGQSHEAKPAETAPAAK